jgi:hypothetical protein
VPVVLRLWPTYLLLIGGVLIRLVPYGVPPSTSFYEMSAQIIPVLIVALAVESRAHDLWAKIPDIYNVQIVVFLAVGELSSVLAASGAFAADSDLGYVGPTAGTSAAFLAGTVAALVGGFLAVLFLALGGGFGARGGRSTHGDIAEQGPRAGDVST